MGGDWRKHRAKEARQLSVEVDSLWDDTDTLDLPDPRVVKVVALDPVQKKAQILTQNPTSRHAPRATWVSLTRFGRKREGYLPHRAAA